MIKGTVALRGRWIRNDCGVIMKQEVQVSGNVTGESKKNGGQSQENKQQIPGTRIRSVPIQMTLVCDI